MPLIDITLKPGYRMKMRTADPNFTVPADVTVKFHFAEALPALLVDHAEELGLATDTPPEGIQVMRHDYDEYDVNVANVWVKFQFSEDQPQLAERLRIRDRLYELLIGWFRSRELEPENFVMDLFWGPTNGRGSVDGVEIEW